MEIKNYENKILQGNCLEKLKELPDKSIHICITSPPYWNLRDYGVEGQLGLERTYDKYITKLCDIFDEVKRVLRDDGTCWVNLGDTYFAKPKSSESGGLQNKNYGNKYSSHGYKAKGEQYKKNSKNYQDKCLCMIPERFAIEMINRGWTLRNTIIWHKRNCMPTSVKDRFTVDFEYIFFFSKNKNYYFEQQFVPLSQATIDDIHKRNNMSCLTGEKGSKHYDSDSVYSNQKTSRRRDEYVDLEKGRNMRAVWTINTKPYPESHFAVFPEELVETPLKAGCPEYICKKCGKPRVKQYNSLSNASYTNDSNYERQIDTKHNQEKFNRNSKKMETVEKEYLGLSDCGCNAGFSSGIVLDPFFGSGTTGLVALKQRKKFIGIELNPSYIAIAQKRLKLYIQQSDIRTFI